ncbi:glycosyltransferase family 2 protein [Candidatus Woesearchaeota archaeon]|nr:glycosyltransferase family 2 protein [Candidatus Woesearchaeota archaeon]
MEKKLSLIIPCYNEEDGIKNLHERLMPVISDLSKRYSVELLFIDDGSTDKTNEMLQKYFGQAKSTKIIKHNKNLNLGAAFRTGFAKASGDIIVTLDSDCTYRPEEIPNLLEQINSNNFDIITGSPYHPKGGVENVPAYRIFLSKSVSILYKIATGKNIYTFTSMFRAYKKEVIKNIEFRSNDFLSPAEILLVAINKGYKIGEYPTVLHVRKFGKSKFNKLFMIMRRHMGLLSSEVLVRLSIKSNL